MCAPRVLREGECCLQAIVKEIADQSDLDELAAKMPGLVDLLLRRGDRHEHNAPFAEMAADKGETLGVVAGGRADEEPGAVAGLQRLAEEVERSTNLVGTDRRQILALEEHMRARLVRQVDVLLEGRLGEKATHRGRRCRNAFSEIGHASIPSSRIRHIRSGAVAGAIAYSSPRSHSPPEKLAARRRQVAKILW